MQASQLISENIVRMARNMNPTNAKFQFSKVKLRPNKPQLPPYYENNNDAKKKDLSITTTSSSPPSSIHHLDLHTATIVILFLFSVTSIICMVTMFRTSLMQSTQSGTNNGYNKSCSQYQQNLPILETY